MRSAGLRAAVLRILDTGENRRALVQRRGEWYALKADRSSTRAIPAAMQQQAAAGTATVQRVRTDGHASIVVAVPLAPRRRVLRDRLAARAGAHPERAHRGAHPGRDRHGRARRTARLVREPRRLPGRPGRHGTSPTWPARCAATARCPRPSSRPRASRGGAWTGAGSASCDGSLAGTPLTIADYSDLID